MTALGGRRCAAHVKEKAAGGGGFVTVRCSREGGRRRTGAPAGMLMTAPRACVF